MFGFGKQKEPPKDPSEMTEEEKAELRKRNKRALAILGIGCILAVFMMLQGVQGMLQADREREMLCHLTSLEQAELSTFGPFGAGEETDAAAPAIPAQFKDRAVVGQEIKLSKAVIAVLRPRLYLGVNVTAMPEYSSPILNPNGVGELALCEVTDPGLLTQQEKGWAVEREGKYYLLSLRGTKLGQGYYAAADPDFFRWVLEEGERLGA